MSSRNYGYIINHTDHLHIPFTNPKPPTSFARTEEACVYIRWRARFARARRRFNYRIFRGVCELQNDRPMDLLGGKKKISHKLFGPCPQREVRVIDSS